MANGKPGDHPLTDILHWKSEVFGAAADSLIREICGLGGDGQLERRFDLLSLDPRFPRQDQPPFDLARFEYELRQLRDDLRAEAVRRGWQITPPDEHPQATRRPKGLPGQRRA